MSESHIDDFSAFADVERELPGLFERVDVFRMIRSRTELGLRNQVPDSVLERIETFGDPKFVVFGKATDEPSRVIVTHSAFCVRARLFVSYHATEREVVDATLTFFFGNLDVPENTIVKAHFDLHHEAELNFTDDQFESRVLAFRAEI